MYTVKIIVKLKEGVINPTGIATKDALKRAGFGEVENVRVGKVIELKVEKKENIEDRVKEMCEKLLVNMVMEEYTYTVE